VLYYTLIFIHKVVAEIQEFNRSFLSKNVTLHSDS